MWLWFWLLVIALLFSAGGFYGRRGGYYEARGFWTWLLIVWILFVIAAVFMPWWGPWWGYTGYGYY